MPFENMHVISVAVNQHTLGANERAAPPGVVIDCENGGSGCQGEAD